MLKNEKWSADGCFMKINSNFVFQVDKFKIKINLEFDTTQTLNNIAETIFASGQSVPQV